MVSLTDLPATKHWMRFAALSLGIVLLLWLPLEDTDERNVLLLALAICSWWGTRFIVRLAAADDSSFLRHFLIGLLSGMAVTPLALALMAFKTGVHGHGTPDFTIEQILTVLRLAPFWIVIGILLALGTGLIRKT